jgi:regulatory protein
MPIVSRIQRQSNRASRYSVFLDNKFAFAISENDLIASGIRQGQELALKDVERFKEMAELSLALDSSYSFLSYRARSSEELKKYLAGKGFSEGAISGVCLRLIEQKLLDDATFADLWIGNRQKLKPRSRRQLEHELRSKGLDGDTVTEAVSRISDEDELLAVQSMIKKKLTRYPDQSKLIQYLTRQGFAYQAVKRALNELGLGATGSDKSIS